MRAVKVGSVTVRPGRAAVVRLGRSGVRRAIDAVPAWLAVGNKPGPRLTVLAAPRGYEEAAALAASSLRDSINPATLAGTLLVVPVLRPGGRFARGGRPARSWRFPGSVGGERPARRAFAIWSEAAVGSSLLVVLGAPGPARRAVLTARGDLKDARVRRAAMASRAAVAVSAPGRRGSLLAAAAAAGIPALALVPGGTDADAAAEAATFSFALGGLMKTLGMVEGGAAEPGPPPIVVPTPVNAPAAGLVTSEMRPGTLVRRGQILVRVTEPATGKITSVASPATGVVLEITTRTGVRRGARLAVVGVTRGQDRPTRLWQNLVRLHARTHDAPGSGRRQVGWAERVALPDLGIAGLKAKIDTGARTSALHVTGLRTVESAGGRAALVEFRLPGRSARKPPMRAAVREHVVVRDTSGRAERRPVIETTLQLGGWRKRIRVTLTHRGDMLFPMLIGRTALGDAFVVDPSRRYAARG